MNVGAEYRRCLGTEDGAVYTLESAVGRGPKGSRSVVCRYESLEGEGEVLYATKERLHDALWISPNGALHVVDARGYVHRGLGGAWSSARASKLALHAIAGIDDSFVIAGGEGGPKGLARSDGTRWRTAEGDMGLEALEPSAQVIQIAATAPDDLYVVAHDPFEVPTKCSLLHFDGTRWTPMEMRATSGKGVRQIAKKGIPSRVNGVFCRSRDEVVLTGPEGLLLVGNAREGWTKVGDLRRNQKSFCPCVVGDVVYFAWQDDNRRAFGIRRLDGPVTTVVRDDLLPWFATSRGSRMFFSWHGGFGWFDGERWALRGAPDRVR